MEFDKPTNLGDRYRCAASTGENFELRTLHRNTYGEAAVAFRFSESDTNDNDEFVIRGSVHLTRDKVEELATTLLFWLQETDPDKEG